jgi:hypothetical protein
MHLELNDQQAVALERELASIVQNAFNDQLSDAG